MPANLLSCYEEKKFYIIEISYRFNRIYIIFVLFDFYYVYCTVMYSEDAINFKGRCAYLTYRVWYDEVLSCLYYPVHSNNVKYKDFV